MITSSQLGVLAIFTFGIFSMIPPLPRRCEGGQCSFEDCGPFKWYFRAGHKQEAFTRNISSEISF
jgi:hypothetical protein